MVKAMPVGRTQGTLASLEFLPRKRLEKVGEEGGGGDKFKGRDEILIFMSVTTKVRLQERGVWRVSAVALPNGATSGESGMPISEGLLSACPTLLSP